MSLPVRFQKMDHQLGAFVISTKITRLGASAFGAKVLAHVGIDVDVVLAWQRPWRQDLWRRAHVIKH
jgi:hypothetical protein